MSREVTHSTPPTFSGDPAQIWATNKGIYLGLVPKGGTDQTRPLAGKELEQSVPRGAGIRSTWKQSGAPNLYVGEGHVGTWGPQGVGKTRKLFLPNMLKLRDWSVVCIDTKGGLAAYTALARAQYNGERVYVVDPCGVIKERFPRLYAKYPKIFKSVGFNPVADLQPYLLDESGGKQLDDKGRPIMHPRFIDDAKTLAMGLISSDDSRDPYWPMAAQALAKGLTLALRLDKPGLSDSLAAFRLYIGLKPKDFAEHIERDIAKFGDNWPAIAASVGQFARDNPDDREMKGVINTAKVQTDWLDSPLFRTDLTKKNVIDFASFKRKPSTCYIILPPDYLASHGPWLRLIVTAALRPMLRTIEAASVPVLFMLDEFAQMGRMAVVEQNIAQMREFGVKLWTVWQDVQQMQDTYKDAWHRFMSTAEAKITFTSNHTETKEYFSKLGDERLFKHTTESETVNISEGRTWGTSVTSGTSDNDGITSGSNLGSSNSRHHSSGETVGGTLGTQRGDFPFKGHIDKFGAIRRRQLEPERKHV